LDEGDAVIYHIDGMKLVAWQEHWFFEWMCSVIDGISANSAGVGMRVRRCDFQGS
jgi:hypothetical protein